MVFLVGYRWQSIQDFFGDGTEFGIRAQYSVEDSPLGRGGAIRQGFSLVPVEVESAIILNGDIITDEEPDAVLANFQEKKSADPARIESRTFELGFLVPV